MLVQSAARDELDKNVTRAVLLLSRARVETRLQSILGGFSLLMYSMYSCTPADSGKNTGLIKGFN